MGSGRRVLIAMLDGFGPDYLEASDMPTLRALIKQGFHKTVEACMPTVTNVNNVGIATGEWPRVHGITANSYFELATPRGALHGPGGAGAGADRLRDVRRGRASRRRSSPPR